MKRIIVYLLAFALFLGIGLRQPRDMLLFEVMVGPYRGFGQFLRTMSLSKGWLNVLAIIMWLSVSFLPLGYLFYRIKKKAFKPIDLILFVIAIGLAVVLYYGINPALMIDHIDPRILESMTPSDIEDTETIVLFGLLSTVYAPLLIYGIIRFIHMNPVKINLVLRLLVDLVSVIIIFEYAGASLPDAIHGIRDAQIGDSMVLSLFRMFKETMLFFLMMIMIRFSFPVLKQFSIRHDALYASMHRLYAWSLIYLVAALSMAFTENLLTFFLRVNLKHIHFQFDLPLFALMIASLLMLFGKYVLESIELRTENELMI